MPDGFGLGWIRQVKGLLEAKQILPRWSYAEGKEARYAT